MFVINIEKLKTLKYHIFLKTLHLSLLCNNCGHDYKKIFKEEESMLGILGLITNIEEYQKIYDYD